MPPVWPRNTTPDSIGSIGNTQGVKVRPRPARKNNATARQDRLRSLLSEVAALSGAAPSPAMLKDSVSGG